MILPSLVVRMITTLTDTQPLAEYLKLSHSYFLQLSKLTIIIKTLRPCKPSS